MMTIAGTVFNARHQALEIYVSGCLRGCPGCHNQELSVFGKGKSWRLWLKENRYKLTTPASLVDRVWIMGGDLLDQPPTDALEFVRDLRAALREDKELWLWTGHALSDVSEQLRAYLDWIKAGEYHKDLPSCTYTDLALTLASNNQELYYKENWQCPYNPSPDTLNTPA